LSAGLPISTGTLDKSALLASIGQVPLSFEANKGQTDPQVRFLSRGNGYGLFLTPSEAVLSLQQDSLHVQFVGANPNPVLSGADQQSTTSNYFIGNAPSQWHTNLANFGRIVYQGLYPGVNLVYYGNQSQLEYDFQVAPGADPGVIQLKFEGAQSMELDRTGNLILHATGGDVVEHAPVLYQETGATRQAVSGQFVLEGNNQVGFRIGNYDHSKPLTIDPVLSFFTYIGGSGRDDGVQLAVDSTGNAYVVGRTFSTNFPTINPVQSARAGSVDAYVSKLNAAGTALVYSTYIGGNEAIDEVANGIAVNAAGEAYVTGYTDASNFPVANAIQATYGGGGDGFVFKLSASGSTLLYSTYLGGSALDNGFGIALDTSGNAYVAGYTDSTNFPTANAFQSTNHGGRDAFLTKITSDGSALVYSTYLGGSGSDQAAYQCVAVDSAGSAYLTGGTTSTNFPTVNPFQPTLAGGGDAFVVKFAPDGSGLVYSSYLGGNTPDDTGQAIAVDSSGNAYVGGFTNSSSFPTVNAVQPSIGGGRDGFITKISADGSTIIFSTFLGGSGEDRVLALALDGGNNIYATGETLSGNFPTVNATQPNNGGGWDAFVTRMNAAGTALDFSTFLGGNGDDAGSGVAIDVNGNLVVLGGGSSSNLPNLNPLPGFTGGGGDDFVAKFSGFSSSSNTAPQVNAGADQTIPEGGTYTATGSFTDPDADTWTATVDYGDGSGVQPLALNPNKTFSLIHVYADNGNYTVTVTVTDSHSNTGMDTVAVTVNNVAPTATLGNNGPVDEGSPVTVTFTSAFDPSSTDTAAGFHNCYATTIAGLASTYAAAADGASKSFTFADNGSYTVYGRIFDKDGGYSEYQTTVVVNNVAPAVGAITAPVAPFQVGGPISASAGFTDAGVLDTHTAVWDWGDGTTSGTVTEANGSGTVADSHTYTAAGVYTIKLTVTDNNGASGQSVFQYVVVYDPSAGFVTGGGWINSPAGAYAANPSLTGRANFGFVARYKPGATVPDGNTEFQFQAAGFTFKSTAYDWLVVSGAKARYRGTGTVNGSGGYGFELTAWDGQVNGGGGTDRLRLKVWNTNQGNAVVYDNQMNAPDGADPTTALGAGSIVIHTNGSPQLAAGGQGPGGPGAAPISTAQVAALLPEAIARWAATGLPARDVARLRATAVEVTDLPDGYLGAAPLYGTVISLDANAAGYGWFVDPTPADDAEFDVPTAAGRGADRTSPATGRMDLLTVVMHELGHVLGLDSRFGGDPSDLMTAELRTGDRRTPISGLDAPRAFAPARRSADDWAWGWFWVTGLRQRHSGLYAEWLAAADTAEA
jgi:hypothetical protein